MQFKTISEVIRYLEAYLDRFGDIPCMVIDSQSQSALSVLRTVAVMNIHNDDGNQDVVVFTDFDVNEVMQLDNSED